MASKIPDFCDYDCPHADFAPAYTAGICRTMSAVWCGKLDELVNKNAPCEWRERGGEKNKSTSSKQPKRKTAKKTAKSAKKSTRTTAKKKSTRKAVKKNSASTTSRKKTSRR